MDTVKGSAAPLTVNTWTPTEKNEMQTFLGLTVLMGIVYKPRLAMYWSIDLVYKASISRDSMAQDRFLHLLRFIHFADNDCLDTSWTLLTTIETDSITTGQSGQEPKLVALLLLTLLVCAISTMAQFCSSWVLMKNGHLCQRCVLAGERRPVLALMLCRHCMAQVCQ